MKKFIVTLSALFLCLNLAIVNASAYDFREDTLEKASDADEIYAMEEEILEQVNILADPQIDLYHTEENQGVPRSVLFEQAVRVYNFELSELIDALNSNLEATLQSNDWVVWEIPIEGCVSGSEKATIGIDGFTATWSEYALASDVYLTTPQTINQLLGNQVFDSAYIVGVPMWALTFVVTINGDDVVLAPYAARPEFMPFENGVWYSAEELSGMLEEFLADTQSVAGFGGGLGEQETEPDAVRSDKFFVAATVSALSSAFILLICFHRAKHHR